MDRRKGQAADGATAGCGQEAKRHSARGLSAPGPGGADRSSVLRIPASADRGESRLCALSCSHGSTASVMRAAVFTDSRDWCATALVSASISASAEDSELAAYWFSVCANRQTRANGTSGERAPSVSASTGTPRSKAPCASTTVSVR